MPKRIQRRRTAGWRMPVNTVYVGRPTRWGNPFRAGVTFCGPTIRCLYTPTELVAEFRSWLATDTLHPLFWDKELITAHVAIKVALQGRVLAGKDLACWCRLDQPCHADVLLEIANAPAADHPHTDPGDGRTECERCGKYVWPAIHSCKGIPVTAAAKARGIANAPVLETTPSRPHRDEPRLDRPIVNVPLPA